jgi:hypothetical protein
MEIIAERVQNGLRAVVPGKKLFHGNIASGFHRFPLAERNKNEPESPDGQARIPAVTTLGLPQPSTFNLEPPTILRPLAFVVISSRKRG